MLRKVGYLLALVTFFPSLVNAKPLPSVGDSIAINMSGDLALLFYKHIDRLVEGESSSTTRAELIVTVEAIDGKLYRLTCYRPCKLRDGTLGLVSFRSDVREKDIANLVYRNHPLYAEEQGKRLRDLGVDFVVDMENPEKCELKTWELSLHNGTQIRRD